MGLVKLDITSLLIPSTPTIKTLFLFIGINSNYIIKRLTLIYKLFYTEY